MIFFVSSTIFGAQTVVANGAKTSRLGHVQWSFFCFEKPLPQMLQKIIRVRFENHYHECVANDCLIHGLILSRKPTSLADKIDSENSLHCKEYNI